MLLHVRLHHHHHHHYCLWMFSTWPCLTIGYTDRPYDLMIPFFFHGNHRNIHALAYYGVQQSLLRVGFTLLDYAAITMTTFLFITAVPIAYEAIVVGYPLLPGDRARLRTSPVILLDKFSSGGDPPSSHFHTN